MTHDVVLFDDHSLLRNGIKNWIETHSDFKIIYEAGTYEDCLDVIEKLKMAQSNSFTAIVDISFKTGHSAQHEENFGFEIIKQLRTFRIPSIVFSGHDSGGFVERAVSLEIGAKGFVSKTADESVLLAALNAVSDGGSYIQAELVSDLLVVRDITQTFTKKEKLVADSLTLYNTNADVAASLGITEKTVVNYLTMLYDKAGVSNKTQFLEKMGRI